MTSYLRTTILLVALLMSSGVALENEKLLKSETETCNVDGRCIQNVDADVCDDMDCDLIPDIITAQKGRLDACGACARVKQNAETAIHNCETRLTHSCGVCPTAAIQFKSFELMNAPLSENAWREKV
jgi:hypothetical protein